MASGSQTGRKKRENEWTEEMTSVLLECKRKAVELTSSDNPPLQDNGRKKGYMCLMKELWEERGYEDLGLTAQNLRDQAARTEKNSRQCNTDDGW